MADDINKTIKGIKVNGTICNLDLTEIGSYMRRRKTDPEGDNQEIADYIEEHGGGGSTGTSTELISANGTKFDLKVYDDGTLYADEVITDVVTPSRPSTETWKDKEDTSVAKLYINSFYCGGLDADEHTLNYCSHNFVELSNLTSNDISLANIALQYKYGNASAWRSFKLSGVIKAGGTFLIRFAQCSNIDCAKIVVDDYDLEIADAKFSTESPSFYLCFGEEPITGNISWDEFSENSVSSRFIDLIGVWDGEHTCNSYATAYYTCKDKAINEVMFRRYYAMDGVKQGTKALNAMNNSTEWYYVDLTKDDGDLIPSIAANTPKARIDNKSLYFDKTKLFESKPSIITCSFGIQAVDEGAGATRCFNWVSKGRHDEFIWIRKSGTTNWDRYESFKSGSDDPEYKRFIIQDGETVVYDYAKFYNRISVEYNDGIVFTAHKYIKHGLEAGVYEYMAGRSNRNGEPIVNQCTEIRRFTVRTYNEVKDIFKYVQTSDQQGFKWEEYVIWDAAAKVIASETGSSDVHFMINTGDMVQNGSRMCEWLDYFNGKGEFLNNMEEMATVGNNDLSGKYTYLLPDGEDASKLSLENFNYFYTYEMDIDNAPVFTVPVQETTATTVNKDFFIPSLYSFNYGDTHFMCVTSEIKTIAENNKETSKEYQSIYNCPTYGNFYPQIKTWCENDIAKNTKTWNLAFCHELPFHIMTTGTTYTWLDKKTSQTIIQPYSDYASEILDGTGGSGRGGASINVNLINTTATGTPQYWFSEFCQTHNIRLIMGGHKHTQSTSWPMLENVKYENGIRSVISYRPKIVLKQVQDFDPAADDELVTATVTITGNSTPFVFEAKYPSTWVTSDDGGLTHYVTNEYVRKAAFCEFMLESELPTGTKPVVYAMSQATSYKHTSNKELPSDVIPYLRYYYPTHENDTKPDPKQKFPFYTVWTVDTDSAVTGDVRKVLGAFDKSGKFDINKDGKFVLNGISAVDPKTEIKSINGLGTNVDTGSTEQIIITLH